MRHRVASRNPLYPIFYLGPFDYSVNEKAIVRLVQNNIAADDGARSLPFDIDDISRPNGGQHARSQYAQTDGSPGAKDFPAQLYFVYLVGIGSGGHELHQELFRLN